MDRLPNERRREVIATLRAAAPALAVAASALVRTVVAFLIALFRHPLDLVVSLVGLVLAASSAVAASFVRGPVRRILFSATLLLAAAPVALLLLRGKGMFFVFVVGLLVVAVGAVMLAVRSTWRPSRPTLIPGTPIGPAARPVLFTNPRSGGGKAQRFGLAPGIGGRPGWLAWTVHLVRSGHARIRRR
jgi:hypothetical protein